VYKHVTNIISELTVARTASEWSNLGFQSYSGHECIFTSFMGKKDFAVDRSSTQSFNQMYERLAINWHRSDGLGHNTSRTKTRLSIQMGFNLMNKQIPIKHNFVKSFSYIFSKQWDAKFSFKKGALHQKTCFDTTGGIIFLKARYIKRT
jgi:hypothetical protein